MIKYKSLFVILTALCSLASYFLFPASAFAQVDTAWVRIYNGPGNGADEARSLAVDEQGNVYVTGYSRSSGTDDDYATIKYNANGVEQWVRRYNGPGNDDDGAYSIAVDAQGNVYVSGESYDSTTGFDCTTIKYNSNGDTVWVRRYTGLGNYSDAARSIAVDGQGNVYVTGFSYSSSTAYDYATIKYNSAGDTVWVRRYNGPGNYYDFAYSLAIDVQGNVYVTGLSAGISSSFDYATIKYNSMGVQEWVARYNGPENNDDWAHSLAVDAQGNVYVTGESRGSGTYEDYATIKYNASGDTLWLRRYNGPGNGADIARSLAVDGQGNVYVTGESPVSGTNYDYATIKYNTAGVQEWVQRYNGPGNSLDKAYALAVDGQCNVYVTGGSRGSTYIEDYATIKYNSAGDTIWVRRYNGPGNSTDNASAIAVDNAGNVYVTGSSFTSGVYSDYATIKYVQIGAVAEEHSTPDASRFKLNAEPNPFCSHTAIRYSLSVESKVSLNLYDISGRLVKTLVDEHKNPGNYQVTLSTKNLSAGIYFLSLETEEKRIIERVIVIK
jgi:uncharacterized delta-60 repeat protein